MRHLLHRSGAFDGDTEAAGLGGIYDPADSVAAVRHVRHDLRCDASVGLSGGVAGEAELLSKRASVSEPFAALCGGMPDCAV